MKVSGFTFLRNAHLFGYPFVQSIKSILPICDEFIVNVGEGEDDTLEKVKEIDDPRICIIQNRWNENMRTKGYVYGQQKSIAHFNCTGDWAFYLEADEVVHENDLPVIKSAMQKYLDDDGVEALVFDFVHFYGNKNTYIWSPGWYRRAPRIIKNSVPSCSPDGLFFIVMIDKKHWRYPRAASSGATIYHYGWIRNEDQMNLKFRKIGKYWNKINNEVNYTEIDAGILKTFKESHPEVIKDWLPDAEGLYRTNPHHVLTLKEKKHRIGLFIEKI
ncbi:MAG TPA: glycosyltransferase, partial [Nitrospirae bacterium]|nr:glycosyltransferase [Nitrospirota bacterium]